MRVAITAIGSRGDVAPYTGLGVRLQQAGHEVTIATHAVFEPLVRGHGLRFHLLPMDAQEQLRTRFADRGLVRMTMAVHEVVAEHARPLATAMLAAAREADVLLVTPTSWFGVVIAEGLGIPSLGVYLQPLTPTREFPPPALTRRDLGGWANHRLASLLLTAGQRPFRSVVGELRRELGLPGTTPSAWLRAQEAKHWPILYGYSPLVVPTPKDWPAWYRPVGYWWPAPEPGFAPAPELERFLAAGPPPVYVGFGSMPVPDRDRLSSAVAAAVRRAGVRAIVSAGWSGLTVEADDVLAVGEVPHEWLFPRVAAVVHHAGAGTTAAGLRAGVPHVPVPVMVDQPFWAQRLRLLGVTPGPIPVRRLTAGRLADALTAAVTDPRYRRRARALAARLSEEDGAGAVLRELGRLTSATA
ncbi:glycosyltransferase [Dactylosporangium sp. CA-139114]|uniref:glycosyltransferase n=1 Tax=Dactylosporangium sp. CA-139114 TaxID=3239931 RepID=UPI003D99646E